MQTWLAWLVGFEQTWACLVKQRSSQCFRPPLLQLLWTIMLSKFQPTASEIIFFLEPTTTINYVLLELPSHSWLTRKFGVTHAATVAPPLMQNRSKHTIPTAFCDLCTSLDFLDKAVVCCISNLLICICLTFLHGVFSHETHSASIFLFPTLLSSFQKNTSIALLHCLQLIESKIQIPIGLHQIKDLNLWFSKANNTNKTPLQQW